MKINHYFIKNSHGNSQMIIQRKTKDERRLKIWKYMGVINDK